jgi:hypothetical protein
MVGGMSRAAFYMIVKERRAKGPEPVRIPEVSRT